MSSYITSYTGKHFEPANPDPECIVIEDIAHALSLICRGNGHVKTFWSVGQHCVCCAKEAWARGYSNRMVLACLLHDASECYMSDIPRPFKKSLPEYQERETALLEMIYTKFLGSPLTNSGTQSAVLEENMRLFVAINLSGTMKAALINTQNEMYDYGVRGNYTKEENLHLTLAFIGEYHDPQAVMDALSTVSFTPFTLELEGMGCFGDLWWAGMKDSTPLNVVARRVRRALAEKEIPYDRKRFSPHITLIRKASGEVPGIQTAPVSMTVTGIALMRSDRGRRGMIYTEVGTIDAE